MSFYLILSHCTGFINGIQGDVHFNVSVCEILNSHSCESEVCRFPGCVTGWVDGEVPTLRKIFSAVKTESEASSKRWYLFIKLHDVTFENTI